MELNFQIFHKDEDTQNNSFVFLSNYKTRLRNPENKKEQNYSSCYCSLKKQNFGQHLMLLSI